MKKYELRRTVTAYQWDGEPNDDISEMNLEWLVCDRCTDRKHGFVKFMDKTSDTKIVVCIGDYIVSRGDTDGFDVISEEDFNKRFVEIKID